MYSEKPLLKWWKPMQSPRGVLQNFSKFIGKRLCWSLFLNKAGDWRTATLLRTDSSREDFLVNFAKFSRTLISMKTSRRLLLEMTQENFWHFGEILCKYIFFNQTQALNNLSWCVAHSVLAIFLRKVPQKVIALQSDCCLAGFHILLK